MVSQIPIPLPFPREALQALPLALAFSFDYNFKLELDEDAFDTAMKSPMAEQLRINAHTLLKAMNKNADLEQILEEAEEDEF